MTDAITPGDRRVGDPGTITFDEHVVDNPATHRVQLLNTATGDKPVIEITVIEGDDPLDVAAAAADAYDTADRHDTYLVNGAPEPLA
jgi:hypothetical protein